MANDTTGSKYWLDGQPIIINVTVNDTGGNKYWLDGQPIVTTLAGSPPPPPPPIANPAITLTNF